MVRLLSCGPLLLLLVAWSGLRWVRAEKRSWLAIVALVITTANAVYAAHTYWFYSVHPPSSWLPPWRDPQVLDFGLLFLLAPVGMIVGAVAAARGSAKWLIWILELASLPLLVLGLLAGAAV